MPRENNKNGYKHGGRHTPEYLVWSQMKQRCFNKNCYRYEYYGGRGITVCDRWETSFPNFILDMGKRPSNKYSVERIDNNKGYSPENCKWATMQEQKMNTRLNKNNKSGYNGVSFHKASNKWRVTIGNNHYGCFKSKEEAIVQREEVEVEYLYKIWQSNELMEAFN